MLGLFKSSARSHANARRLFGRPAHSLLIKMPSQPNMEAFDSKTFQCDDCKLPWNLGGVFTGKAICLIHFTDCFSQMLKNWSTNVLAAPSCNSVRPKSSRSAIRRLRRWRNMSMTTTSNLSRLLRRYRVRVNHAIIFVEFYLLIIFQLDLESEMYQLSHILQEQRNTLALLHDESLTDEQRNQIAEQESCM